MVLGWGDCADSHSDSLLVRLAGKELATMLDAVTGSIRVSEESTGCNMVDVLFGGELCPRGRTEMLAISGRSTEVFSEIRSEVARSDLFIVNLEAPLTNTGSPVAKSGPNLRCDPRCVELLRAGGVDVAVCANNHIGDFGPAAVMETFQQSARNDIATVGAGASLAEARRPLIVEKNGQCIAFLAFAENELCTATEDSAGSSPLNTLRNIRDISAAAQEADTTVVLIHGGNEHCPVPSPRMVQLYGRLPKQEPVR